MAGTSFSGKGADKKEESKGGSDIWLIRINEFGDEILQKTLGGAPDDEARSVIQTSDLGFMVAGNIQGSTDGFGSKDVLVSRLDKNGKLLSEIILGGKGLDEVERMIPTPDGGALLGIYSRSSSVKAVQSIAGKGNNKTDKDSIKPSIYAKSTENYGEGDYLIVKLNKEGKVF